MIKLFNNLNTIQSISIKDRSGKYYTTFIESRRTLEVEPYQVTQDVLDKISRGTILEIGNNITIPVSVNETHAVVDTVIIDNGTAEDTLDNPAEDNNYNSPATTNVDDDAEDQNDQDKTNTNSFICDICKAEFASNRGLQMHINKSHKTN